MTATTDRCPGCHGSGIEMSGVTYAGMSEYVGCHECGPECPDDCGCRVSDDLALIAPPARDAVSDAEAAECARLRATVRSMLGDAAAEGRCGCVALCEGPQEDCPLHGRDYAWWVGLAGTACADREWLMAENARLRAGIEALLADVDRLTAERDGDRLTRVIATRAFETTRRVLQEASGLPDDIDDPDCRDEMVLALRPRAEKAEAEVARLAEEATVSAALLETEIAKREAAEMRANRATADLDALESEDRRQDVQAKHWREVLRIRRELDGIRREMNDVTEIIAEALGYRPSGLPLDGWPHLSTTGDHTPTSLAAEAAGVLAKASRLRAGIEALAAEMQSDTCPACHASYADEGSTTWGCDHTEGMQHAGDMLRALLAEGGE